MQRLSDIEVRAQASPLEQLNRTFRVAKTQLQCQIHVRRGRQLGIQAIQGCVIVRAHKAINNAAGEVAADGGLRSEEHTSELQSLMRISYAVFCLKKKTKKTTS